MLDYLAVLRDIWVIRVQAVRADTEKDRGASALEWAIIAAISVVMATIIGAVIYNIVKGKSSSIKACATQAAGSTCAP